MASAAGIKKSTPRKPKAKNNLGTALSQSSEIYSMDATFPLSAAEQGSEITTVNVGIGLDSQTFRIHKNLLCKASKCFDGTLNDGFMESRGNIKLPSDHPVAFEVLYQWLYSGLVREASFVSSPALPLGLVSCGHVLEKIAHTPSFGQTSDLKRPVVRVLPDVTLFGGPVFLKAHANEGLQYTKHFQDISPALLWLRVYKFADCRLIQSLQKVAYKRFCNCFKILTLGYLTSQLVDELYDDTSSEHLQHYLVHHAAYHMGRPMIKGPDQGNWKDILDHNSDFKAATGAKVIDGRLSGEFKHPSVLEEFQNFKAGQSESVDVKPTVSTGPQQT